MGARVHALLAEAGTVVRVHGTRHGQEAFAIRADAVVGADGRFSALRRLGNFEIAYRHNPNASATAVMACNVKAICASNSRPRSAMPR